MSEARFGPAGFSDDFKSGYGKTADIARYAADIGLDAFEYQFGRGVRMSGSDAALIKADAAELGVTVSAHAPYYISLSSEDETKRQASLRYFVEAATAVRAMGGSRIVVHSGSVGKMTRGDALTLALQTLKLGVAAIDEAGFSDVSVCPETMGKLGQLGDLDEVLMLCGIDEHLIPCIDFGHLNARTQGSIRGADDYAAILTAIENELGFERLCHMHIHFSKIEYTAGGEKRHLTLSDTVYGPDPLPLLALIAKKHLLPTVICESDGTQGSDARTMRELYRSLL